MSEPATLPAPVELPPLLIDGKPLSAYSDRELLEMVVRWQVMANTRIAEAIVSVNKLLENPMVKNMMEMMG